MAIKQSVILSCKRRHRVTYIDMVVVAAVEVVVTVEGVVLMDHRKLLGEGNY